MKLKSILTLAVCGLAILMTGCVGTLDGRHTGGTPFKRDKLEGCYERSVTQVFEASKTVLNRLGKVNREEVVNKTLYGKVDTRDVWIKVQEVDTKLSKVIVQVRTKGGGTDLPLTAQIEKEIALTLASVK